MLKRPRTGAFPASRLYRNKDPTGSGYVIRGLSIPMVKARRLSEPFSLYSAIFFRFSGPASILNSPLQNLIVFKVTR